MKTIKFTKDKHKIYLNGIEYKGYHVGDLPNSFGFKEKSQGIDEDGIEQFKFGKDNWFNYKGLTFIEAPLKW
ncbi:hypothetical protein DRO61_03330 [Candidatus Bathyarchaeota archaeon]|nr:MAG: hypothetical protein DRO61_03330 [Candidatus Bathyarchaeota archaeon]